MQGRDVDYEDTYKIITLLRTTTLLHEYIATRFGFAKETVSEINQKYHIRTYITRRTWYLDGDKSNVVDGRGQ